MIRHQEVRDLVVEWQIREDIIEKDYVIGWLLWGIGSEPGICDTWIFKGGTCLKKCYLETYRFSEDLDFTVVPEGPIQPDDVVPIIARVLVRVSEASGIDFSVREPRFKLRSQETLSAQGRVYFRGPRGAPTAASVKIDLTASETVVLETVMRRIEHPFSDELPPPREVRCYSPEEVLAEKIRALGERCRPRDLYDVVNLYRREDFQASPETVRSALVEKCEAKRVPVSTLPLIEGSQFRDELFSEWDSMLAHQLPNLPPIEVFLEELPGLFQWLEAAAPRVALPSVTPQVPEDTAWSPPPTVHAWGIRVPLESIRFAAINRLCVELGYQGSTRIIEPYSLRMSRAGDLLLYGIRVDNRQLRCYRVDRIESARVTRTPFKPAYAIEFTARSTPPAPAVSTRSTRVTTRSRRQGAGMNYIVECPYCGKRFTRSKRDTALRSHKDKSGLPCSCRRGHIVETRRA
jgi:predicted nucleotidyltransferase component of viral defense system